MRVCLPTPTVASVTQCLPLTCFQGHRESPADDGPKRLIERERLCLSTIEQIISIAFDINQFGGSAISFTAADGKLDLRHFQSSRPEMCLSD